MGNKFELTGAWRPEFRALDYFTQGFVEALFFTAPIGGEDLTQADFEELAPETLERIVAECAKFQADNAADLNAYRKARADLCERRGYDADACAGHDFLLTRNRHGAGFWDRGLPDDLGERLTDASHKFSEEFDLYRGGDGLLYVF